MKKIILILFLLLLTSCSLYKYEETTNEYKKMILVDTNFGTTSFSYPKDKDYVIQREKSNNPATIYTTSEKENFVLYINHINTTNDSYETSKKNRTKSSSYKEYKWNNFKGYSFNGSKDNINFIIMLKEDNEYAIGLFGTLKTSNDVDATELFKSDEFQKMMNSITFETKK